jgi:hypothetical protein
MQLHLSYHNHNCFVGDESAGNTNAIPRSQQHGHYSPPQYPANLYLKELTLIIFHPKETNLGPNSLPSINNATHDVQ